MATVTLEADPIRLAVDDNGDLVVPLRHARSSEAVKQGIDARMRLIRGEVFYNVTAGVPWYENEYVDADEAIMGQVFDDAKARAELRKAILDTPNTDASTLVLTLDYENSTRSLVVEWQVDTIYGDTITGTTEI